MRSLISLTFDDGLRCQFDKAVPILDGHNMPATFFLIANREATHESWYGHTTDWQKIAWSEGDIENLKRLVDRGHEIGSHSLTHRIEMMQGNALAEARDSKILIEDWLGTRITSFCYPYYHSHAYLGDAVKDAGYAQARGGAQNSYYATPASPSFDRLNVDCRQVSAKDNASEWVRPGHWHILTFHAIGDQRDGWSPVSEKQFAAFIADLARYRDTGDVEVVTFRDGAARLQAEP
jgi:peptidoglycan/xylan/chitin deacetylase (PgdA/CDA1 family)